MIWAIKVKSKNSQSAEEVYNFLQYYSLRNKVDLFSFLGSSLLFVRTSATCASEGAQHPPSCRGMDQIFTSMASPPMGPTSSFCGLPRNPRIHDHHHSHRHHRHRSHHHNRNCVSANDLSFKIPSLAALNTPACQACVKGIAPS
jgi:hypothetical protein